MSRISAGNLEAGELLRSYTNNTMQTSKYCRYHVQFLSRYRGPL